MATGNAYTTGGITNGHKDDMQYDPRKTLDGDDDDGHDGDDMQYDNR